MNTLTATYDGKSFWPEEPVNLAANTRVRILLQPLGDADPRPASFLRLAQTIEIEGAPEDWSENVRRYLYPQPRPDKSD
jgi:hypothetical protein